MMNINEKNKPFMTADRMSALIDGIFAIAMTLLILNIKIPELTGVLSNSMIQNSLITIISPFLSFILSFILLAMFWVINHRQMHYIKSVDNTFLWINILWLLFIVVVPLSSELSGMYSKFAIPHVIFNVNMIGIAVLLYISNVYADKKGLLHESMEERKKDTVQRSCILFIIISFIALGLSYIIPQYSSLVYLTLILDRLL